MSLKRWGSSSLLSLLTPHPPSVISAFLVFPAMFSSVPSSAGLGWETERGGGEEWRPSVAVNSSHLSPGLFFNCSALPAGSSLLWSSATLFFTAFHEYHFAKQLLWGFLAPEITFDHLPLCTCMSVPGIRRTQYLPHAGLFKSPPNLKSQTLLKCFFSFCLLA